MEAGPRRSTDVDTTLPATVAAPVAVAVAVGLVMPIGAGLVVVSMVVIAAVAWTVWREPRGWAAVGLAGRGEYRWLLFSAGGGACALLLAALANAAAEVAMEFPAALWACGPLIVGLAVSPWMQGWIRWIVAVLVVVAGLYAPVLGARYEANAVDARGWAFSAPILGIHPFQTTSIVVDGYGPFDISLNDYVEPDGSRGYGPQALGDALDHALKKIVALHYANGPERARLAFENAEVHVHSTADVRETLDRDIKADQAPRFEVRSGTYGQRSRVQFVCPGRRLADVVDEHAMLSARMCPDKYAAEASAGLGVTGRWAGYSEGRGNERMALSRLFGWTRSDDADGRARVDLERRLLAWIVIAVAWMITRTRFQAWGRGLAALTAVSLVAGMIVTIALLVGSKTGVGMPLAWVPGAPVWRAELWLPLFMIPAAPMLSRSSSARSTFGPWRRALLAVVLLLGTLVVARNPQWGTRASDILGAGHSANTVVAGIYAIADVLIHSLRAGLTGVRFSVLELEGVIASAALILMFVASVELAGGVRTWATQTALSAKAPTSETSAKLWFGFVLAAVVVASRKGNAAHALVL